MTVRVELDRSAAEALADAAEVRCGLLAAHLERMPEDGRALVMADIIKTQRGAEAIRSALAPAWPWAGWDDNQRAAAMGR